MECGDPLFDIRRAREVKDAADNMTAEEMEQREREIMDAVELSRKVE